VADSGGNGAGNGDYKTFMGAGFGTLMIQLSAGTKETPKSASSRAYLRDGLPSLYADGDFGMRFVGALETLLDPIVAMLDALPEHFDPDYAPRDILNLLSAWLGVDLDESQPIAVQRDTIRRAAELGRRRGTKGGLELALSLAFPGVPLRVEDEGKVYFSASSEPLESKPAQFVVYCDKPVSEDVQAAIARCIEQFKPVHTAYRLRVKAPKKKPAES
jgi:phage tail-like protein